MSYRIVPNANFGPFLNFDWKVEHNLIVVCAQKAQAHPITILLPGQLYQRKALDLMLTHETDELCVLPANSEHWARVLRKEIEPK